MFKLQIPYGAIVKFHLISSKDVIGKVVSINRHEITLIPQFFIAKNYLVNTENGISVKEIRPLQTIDWGQEIHINRKSIVTWEYFEFPPPYDKSIYYNVLDLHFYRDYQRKVKKPTINYYSRIDHLCKASEVQEP